MLKMAIITPQNCYHSSHTKKAVSSIVKSTNSIVVQFDRTTGNGIIQFCFCLFACRLHLSSSPHSPITRFSHSFSPIHPQKKIEKEGNVFSYSS